jgi:hypothetical protein
MGRAAAVAFAVALFAFVLPFATVSCDDARVEPTGADLVLRSAPETEGSPPEGADLGELVVAYGGGLATAAFLAFVVSLLGVVRSWPGGWATFGGLVGVAALVFLKTRGSGRGAEALAAVDARVGGILAAGAGAVGGLAAGATWLRGNERPPLRPLAPAVAAALLLFGYLYPSERATLANFAYADTLDLTNPWDGGFWLLPVFVGILFLARRHGASRRLTSFSIGILAVAAADVADEVWNAWREDEVQVGIAPIAFLAGIVTAGAWAITDQWKQLRRPALVPLAAGLAVALLAWLASPANA